MYTTKVMHVNGPKTPLIVGLQVKKVQSDKFLVLFGKKVPFRSILLREFFYTLTHSELIMSLNYMEIRRLLVFCLFGSATPKLYAQNNTTILRKITLSCTK